MKPRLEHSPSWKRSESWAVWPRVESSEPPIEVGSQLVPLRVKFGLSSFSFAERTSSGMPSRIVGSGSEVAVIWALLGSMWIATRVSTTPRSKGPATAGVTIAKLERLAFVGAGHVDLALGPVGSRARSRGDVHHSHLGACRAAWVRLLGGAVAALVAALGLGDACLRAGRGAGELGDQARRGVVTVIVENCWVPSARLRLRTKGEKVPAIGVDRAGVKGGSVGLIGLGAAQAASRPGEVDRVIVVGGLPRAGPTRG